MPSARIRPIRSWRPYLSYVTEKALHRFCLESASADELHACKLLLLRWDWQWCSAAGQESQVGQLLLVRFASGEETLERTPSMSNAAPFGSRFRECHGLLFAVQSHVSEGSQRPCLLAHPRAAELSAESVSRLSKRQ